MKQLLISIIIPTYNRAHLIGETLDSILAQTYTNWECIVVDDGSTDDTAGVLISYIERDSRFKFFRRADDRTKGASSCRNIGFELSQGEYIQYLDSDDIISANKLEVQLEVLLGESETTCAICKWGVFDKYAAESIVKENMPYYKNWVSIKDFFNVLGEYGLYVPIHSYLISRNLVANAGKWNEDLCINDDGEFFTRLLLKITKIVYVEKAIVFYRKNNENGLSSYTNQKLKKLKYSWELIENHLEPFYIGEKIEYVLSAKKRIFEQTKEGFPFFFVLNFFFFRGIITQYYSKRIWQKIKINYK
ncbi:glycosyltransferase family 2 protein [Flavobacterium aquiphilum]|uniref:glycosyltransferase family 2 protein n=1 Tax=Flavobacterium aquiphilum TaxID=3003261 RepID=UPI0024803234|nr:glycosyltransferase family A protein [Flavobacterium aquiphilum]